MGFGSLLAAQCHLLYEREGGEADLLERLNKLWSNKSKNGCMWTEEWLPVPKNSIVIQSIRLDSSAGLQYALESQVNSWPWRNDLLERRTSRQRVKLPFSCSYNSTSCRRDDPDKRPTFLPQNIWMKAVFSCIIGPNMMWILPFEIYQKSLSGVPLHFGVLVNYRCHQVDIQ